MALTISRREWMRWGASSAGGGIKGSNTSHCSSERLGGIGAPALRRFHVLLTPFLVFCCFLDHLLSFLYRRFHRKQTHCQRMSYTHLFFEKEAANSWFKRTPCYHKTCCSG